MEVKNGFEPLTDEGTVTVCGKDSCRIIKKDRIKDHKIGVCYGVCDECINEKCVKDNESKEPFDNVEKPFHYTSGGIECIDAMEAAYGTEAVMNFCICNAFKYQFRFLNKNGVEDLKKCQWYQNKYIQLKEKQK